MFLLNSAIKGNYKNFVKLTLCRNAHGIENIITNHSCREKAWIDAQKKYAEHAHILYSSYLESLDLSYKKRKQAEYNMAKNFRNLKIHLNKESSDIPALLRKEVLEKALIKNILNDENNGYRNPNEVDVKPQILGNWMNDYEFYEGAIDEDGNINSMHGTSDSSIAPSNVPCSGCGAHLHCASVSLPGYIPMEIFSGRTKKELQTIICQRCHFLKHYNIALDVEIPPETYVETISRIKDEFALAIVIVDLLDFPCSIWPGMRELLGTKRPVFIVGNKVDLLPRDSKNLNYIHSCLTQQMKRSGFDTLNIKYISLISAKTGYGIEELITQLQKIWLHKGNVYLLGCTNVGKSSLFNILLNSDYCRPEAIDLVRKATACPWPGTTLQMLKFPILRPSEIRIHQRFRRLFSERSQRAAEEKLRREQAMKTGSMHAAKLIGNVGRTYKNDAEVFDAFSMSSGTAPIVSLNEKSLEYKQARWCYDTPGVMHPDQITNLLTTEELLQLQPSQMINPRAVRLHPGLSVFLAGLGRLDFIEQEHMTVDWLKVFIFSSLNLPIVIVETEHADEIYNKYLGTKVFGLPFGSQERLARWPGLMSCPEDLTIVGTTRDSSLNCDILFSSAGWIGLTIPFNRECTFRAWSPHARGIHVRTPSLIRYADKLVGKRIRYTLAYNLAKPFVFAK